MVVERTLVLELHSPGFKLKHYNLLKLGNFRKLYSEWDRRAPSQYWVQISVEKV
jgi:hypothetical protein